MERFFTAIKVLSSYIYWLSGIALVCVMLLTVSDVILRYFGSPILGVYDLTVLIGGIIIGFALPLSTLKNVHVEMEFLLDKIPPGWEKVLRVISRCLEIFLFLLLGWNLILYGAKLYRVGEVSSTIYLPLYPVVLGIGVSCFINSLVLFYQLVTIFEPRVRT